MMSHRKRWSAAFVALLALAVTGFGAGVGLAEEQPEQEKLNVDMKGAYVRLVYNSEGWVVLGYQVANDSLGADWMLLEVGMTLLKGQKNQDLTREEVTLLTPEEKTVTMATQVEYTEAGRLQALNKRGDLMRDSINYFPRGTTLPCRIGFFSDPTAGSMKPYDKVELAYGRACVGRLFFKVPGGIQYGRYFLEVQLDNSKIMVPFKIMTKKEAKKAYKEWRKMQKENKK